MSSASWLNIQCCSVAEQVELQPIWTECDDTAKQPYLAQNQNHWLWWKPLKQWRLRATRGEQELWWQTLIVYLELWLENSQDMSCATRWHSGCQSNSEDLYPRPMCLASSERRINIVHNKIKQAKHYDLYQLTPTGRNRESTHTQHSSQGYRPVLSEGSADW